MKLRTCQRFLIFTRKIISQETPSLPQTSPWFIEKVVWRTHTPMNILNPVKSSDFDCERSLMNCPLLTRARNLLYSKWSSGDGAPSIISYHCSIAKLLQGRLCNQLSAKGGRALSLKRLKIGVCLARDAPTSHWGPRPWGEGLNPSISKHQKTNFIFLNFSGHPK